MIDDNITDDHLIESFEALYASPLYQEGHSTTASVEVCNQVGKVDDDDDNLRTESLYHTLWTLTDIDPQTLLSSGIRILDIGCGSGGGIAILKSLICSPSSSFVGIDPSKSAITLAKKLHINDSTIRLFTARGDSHLPSLESESFDVIYLAQSANCMKHVDIALAEIERLLKPTGKLVIADLYYKDDGTLLSAVRKKSTEFSLILEKDISCKVTIASKKNSKHTMSFATDLITQPKVQNFYKSNVAMSRDTTSYKDLCQAKSRFTIQVFEKILPLEAVDDENAPCFYDYREIYPQLAVLTSNIETIRAELAAVLRTSDWPDWPEDEHYNNDGEWKVFPFCYTFPADDSSRTSWVSRTATTCPLTTALLKSLGPDLRTALFSRLGPDTTLEPHRGWADLSNHILRCHIGLVIPTEAPDLAAVIVSDNVTFQTPGGIIVFDDSKLHSAYNHSKTNERVVLIVDLARPSYLPKGVAVGGHTEALDEFIQNFK